MGDDNSSKGTANSKFRHLAEEQLRTTSAAVGVPRTDADLQRVVHELEVHQIELEMQNRELSQLRDELELALDKCTDLYDFAPVGYCTMDQKGTIHNANLTVATLLGIDRSSVTGRRFEQFVDAAYHHPFAEFLSRVFEGGCKESCQVKLTKVGEGGALFVRVESRTFNSGQECSVAVIDVSGRKRAEEEYHNIRRRLEWVLANTGVGMWFNELSQGKVTWDVLTRKRFFIDPDVEPRAEMFWNCVHPDDRDMTKAAVKTAILNNSLYEIDHRVVDPVSGDIFWLHSAGHATYAEDGTPIRFDGLNFDITARKKADKILKQSYDELEFLIGERTADLNSANLQLTQEIEERKKAEATLLSAYAEIKELKDRLESENVYLQQEVSRQAHFGDIIGQSPGLNLVFSQVEQVAPMNATVLLLGETGTGKGVIARAIHSRSTRKGRPLVTIDCTTLPASLVESELFGRERGAFTGSDSKQIGRFELADGGTIFLDEIGEMPLELQSKLLRVIQDGEFERLGSPRTIKTDVRIIAATNRNLAKEVKKGKFREDLFYRLNVFPIVLPPLRQRKDDIPLLVNYFVAKFNTKIGKQISTVSKDTLNVLLEHHWPGNVRELESVIERAVIITQGPVLQVLDRFDMFHEPKEMVVRDVMALVELEHDHILQVLQKTGWRIEGKSGAAVLLGLNASTLRARMRKYGIVRA
ncbi:MAG: sigma 54-interacting transcriptional regulator [Desulfuromonadaceae bacterium]|nr:sigma 54-interacting transcriptional regulator [Desulfuromonadaceae bacterium]